LGAVHRRKTTPPVDLMLADLRQLAVCPKIRTIIQNGLRVRGVRAMPFLKLTAGEPWAETWGVMLFPDDEAKRRAYIARLWAGFYPIFEEAKIGEPVPRSVLLSIMKATAATPIDKGELRARYHRGMAAGEQLKVVAAIAQSKPEHASWNAASRLVERQTGRSRAFLYRARSSFLPVIHLWGAYILRGQKCHADSTYDYTALDDLYLLVNEALALLKWGRCFKLDREKAQPILDRDKVDFWVPPPGWRPPTPKPDWPRDGRVLVPMLSKEWVDRVGKKPVKHPQKNLSTPV
jgi:hypothetical protein